MDHDSAVAADPILVPVDAENAATLPTSATKQLKVVDFAITQTTDTPTITKDEAASCSIIRETIRNRKIPDGTAEIIMESWRHTTQSKHEILKNGNNMHYQGMNIPLIHM